MVLILNAFVILFGWLEKLAKGEGNQHIEHDIAFSTLNMMLLLMIVEINLGRCSDFIQNMYSYIYSEF